MPLGVTGLLKKEPLSLYLLLGPGPRKHEKAAVSPTPYSYAAILWATAH